MNTCDYCEDGTKVLVDDDGHCIDCPECSLSEPTGDLTGLLAAETELANLSKRLADEYQQDGKDWPRAWMEKHVRARKALIDARNIILDVIGS